MMLSINNPNLLSQLTNVEAVKIGRFDKVTVSENKEAIQYALIHENEKEQSEVIILNMNKTTQAVFAVEYRNEASGKALDCSTVSNIEAMREIVSSALC